MSLQVCGQCGTRYAIGVDRCPHCSSTDLAQDHVGRVPLAVTAQCTNEACEACGKPRRVVLRRAAMGVVELPRLLCEVCGYQAATGWPGPVKENDDMPKITRHGGATNAAEPMVVGAEWSDDADESTDEHEMKTVGEAGPERVSLPAGALVVAHEASGESAETADEPSPDADQAELADLAAEPDYERWTKDQLKDALDQLGLSTAGNKPELVARLQDAVRNDE